jgi:DNA-binding response OmpR family regulator
MHESTGALSVAIVEDDPRIQQLLLAEIQDEGHYSSAEDFLDNASAQQFDLVLLDLMLPGVDGLTCLKRLQQNDAVTITTSGGDRDSSQLCRKKAGGLQQRRRRLRAQTRSF